MSENHQPDLHQRTLLQLRNNSVNLLNILPFPEDSRTGWPWNEESQPLPDVQADGRPWPSISIITPSFNQGEFIEETIRSVLLQNYPNLEYIIMDGGSNDNTLGIIKKYEKWITYWESEPDRGQSHAINKGFHKCSGEYVNWISSDDLLSKDALGKLASEIVKNGRSFFIGKGIRITEKSQIIDETDPSLIRNFEELIDIKNFWRNGNPIFQQATLYPLEEVIKAGCLNENNHFTMDYELWGNLFKSGLPVIRCNFPVGIFRWYEGQKTSRINEVTHSLTGTAISLIKKSTTLSALKKWHLMSLVWRYRILFFYHNLRSSVGIKRRIRSLVNV